MNEKKNIDRLFQEKFKDFEALPSEHIWQGIEEKLREKKKDRKVIPLWFRLAGVAAVLLIGLLIMNGNFITPGSNGNSVVVEDDVKQNDSNLNSYQIDDNNAVVSRDSSSETIEPNSVSSDIRIVGADNNRSDATSAHADNTAGATSDENASKDYQRRSKYNIVRNRSNKASADIHSNRRNSAVASADEKSNLNNSAKNTVLKGSELVAQQNAKTQNLEQNGNKLGISPDTNSVTNKETIAVTTADDIKKIDTTAIATVVPNALEELLKEKEETKVTQNEPKVNRWQVSSNVAPIYFSSTSTGSPLDSKFANNNKDIKSDLAYGVGVRYALNKKLTMRAGVNSIGMEYSTNDIVFTQNPNARTLTNVDPNVKGALLQFDSKGASNLLAPTADAVPRKFESSLNQRTGYIEIPVELSYKVVDRKFGVEVIGGVSTLFLSENSVSLVSSGLDMEIGKANNLNNTHFSTNVGLGIKYDLFKSVQVNLEPMFKYQLNKFSDSSNYKPYFFGVYTGINYRF